METKSKTLIAMGVATAIGGASLAGASYADHRNGGMDLFDGGPVALAAMDMFSAIDADGDNRLSQAEIDQVRNDRHAAHDADGDGNLSLEEFAGLWHETTRPLTVRAFQILDADGDAVITRAEYDQLLANIVEQLDRNRDGGLSISDRWADDDRGRWWDDD